MGRKSRTQAEKREDTAARVRRHREREARAMVTAADIALELEEVHLDQDLPPSKDSADEQLTSGKTGAVDVSDDEAESDRGSRLAEVTSFPNIEIGVNLGINEPIESWESGDDISDGAPREEELVDDDIYIAQMDELLAGIRASNLESGEEHVSTPSSSSASSGNGSFFAPVNEPDEGPSEDELPDRGDASNAGSEISQESGVSHSGRPAETGRILQEASSQTCCCGEMICSTV